MQSKMYIIIINGLIKIIIQMHIIIIIIINGY